MTESLHEELRRERCWRRKREGMNWHWAHIGPKAHRMYRCTCMLAFRIGKAVATPKASPYVRGKKR